MVYDNPQSLILPIQSDFIYTLFTCFLISLCFLILLSVFTEPSIIKKEYTTESDEYNFMADEHSEQSRLDLATTFIEIDQIQEATPLLEDLLSSRNPITKEKVKQLLKRIQS